MVIIILNGCSIYFAMSATDLQVGCAKYIKIRAACGSSIFLAYDDFYKSVAAGGFVQTILTMQAEETSEYTNTLITNFNITIQAKTLRHISAFCRFYAQHSMPVAAKPIDPSMTLQDYVGEWYALFITPFLRPFQKRKINNCKCAPFGKLLNAANYLKIEGLVELCCFGLAIILKKNRTSFL